jgi:hypothetical protein
MLLFGGTRRGINSETRLRNPIDNFHVLPMTEFEIDKQRNLLVSVWPELFPKIQERKRPTSSYNCHGLTFLSRRGHIDADDEIDKILADDDYEEVTDRENVLPGDVILYGLRAGDYQHSGIVVGVPEKNTKEVWSPFVLSKWGRFGEYIHRHIDVPLSYGKCLGFWREGKND